MENIRQRMDYLVEELQLHNYRYYVLSNPTISDQEFDKLLKELQKLEEEYPDYRREDSPTLRVGGDLTKEFPNFTHIRPMLSLQNTYSREELEDFDKQVRKLLDGQPFTYLVQHKFDGVSLSLHYENGILQHAVTRGDGVQGDEITQNAKTIRTVPLRIKSGDIPANFEVRGEVMMHNDDFAELNRKRVAEGEAPLMNPRNTTSGTLKMQDSGIVASRPLKFYAYYLLSEGSIPDSDKACQDRLEDWGFKVDIGHRVCKDLDEVMDYISKWEQQRHDLPYEIDGVVLKVNEIPLREILGRTSKFPRWAIAYKYEAESAETILKKVTYQVGRTGKVTPVAGLEPVLLAGTVVKRASLYNEDELERLDLHLGDHVMVQKGGEIIPKVVEVVLSKRPQGLRKVVFVKNCPACGTELIRKEGEADYFCPNLRACPPQVKGRVEHFASRKAMNIDGLGSEIISQLVDAGLIRDYADLYDLRYDQLIDLERFADKSAQNLIDSIDASKAIAYERVLFALGIRYVGETVAKKLAKRFPSIHDLMEADKEGIESVHEIGERIAESVVEFFADPDNRERINKLKAAGLQLELAEDKRGESENLKGMSFVVSGTFENFSRDSIKASIESHGGEVKSSVSSKTSFLLAGADAGPSKLAKAEKNKVKVISESDFLEMIQ